MGLYDDLNVALRGVYRHYKIGGRLYEFVGITINSETLEPEVSYRRILNGCTRCNPAPEYGETYHRPLSLFFGPVTNPDDVGELVRRFQRIGDCCQA